MNIEYRQALGHVLAAKREAMGLSKTKFSLMTGVNRATIKCIEEGTENPTVDTLLRFTCGLGVSLADVLVETEYSLVSEEKCQPIPPPLRIGGDKPTTMFFVTRI